jgi:hypothetical protein
MTEAKLGTADQVVGVVLPRGVSSISGDAFNGYTALRSLTIQPGCLKIEEGKVGMGEKTVGNWEPFYEGAMAGCISLATVTLPETCASIGRCAFLLCSGLLQLRVPGFLSGTASASASSVNRIGERAFYGCSRLTRVTIHPRVTSIGSLAFARCWNLAQVTFGPSMANTGEYPCGDCSCLARRTLRSEVASIGERAFYGCSGLTHLMIPSSVKSIEHRAFDGCSGLARLTIPGNIVRIGRGGRYSEVFWGVKGIERVTLVGGPLNPAVVESVEPALAPGAKVASRALAG